MCKPGLKLCQYYPVQRIGLNVEGTTPCQQFLLSQWRYSVHLRDSNCRKNTEFLVNCCTPAFRKLEVHQNAFPAGTLPRLLLENSLPKFL